MILETFFPRAATIQTLGHPAAGVLGWFGGNASSSGIAINEENAYDYSPVFAATRLLSSGAGNLPVRLMRGGRDRKMRSGGKTAAKDHPVFRLVYDAPNPTMTASRLRVAGIIQQVNAGNAYAEIERDGRGVPVALWPIHQSRVRVVREGKELYYVVRMEDGRSIALPKDDVLHVPSPICLDGISGIGVIQHARETIGAGIAAERHAGSSFANGAVPRTVLMHPKTMEKKARDNLREEWQSMYGGTQNAGKTAVLWEDMKLQVLSVSNEDSQFLGVRGFNVTEVARWYGVPPHMIQDLGNATFSNIEHQGRSFVQLSLMPIIMPWEEEMDRKLLTQQERDEGYYIYFDVDEWQRGDSQGRATANQIKFMNGVINQDEWRAEEDDDPLPDGLGQKFYVPANLMEVGKEPPEPPEPAAPAGFKQAPEPADAADAEDDTEEPDEPTEDARLAPARERAVACLRDRLAHMLRVEGNAAERAAGKPGKFLAAVEEFYAGHESKLVEAIAPLVELVNTLHGTSHDAAAIAKEHCERSKARLLVAAEVPADKLPESVAAAMAELREKAFDPGQERDELGQFTDGGGGGSDAGDDDDESSDDREVAREEEDNKVQSARDQEDEDLEEADAKEDEARNEARTAQEAEREIRHQEEDADLAEKFDAEEEGLTSDIDEREASESQARTEARTKEDAASTLSRDQEDTARESRQADEVLALQGRQQAELESFDARESELDSALDDAETDEEREALEKSQTAERKAIDKERAAAEKRHAKEEAALNKQHDKEAADVERQRDKEDAALGKTRDKEDEAAEDSFEDERQANRDDFEKRKATAEKELAKRQRDEDAEAARRNKEEDKKVAADRKQRDAEIKRRREQEDAEKQRKRDDEDRRGAA